MHKVLKSCNVSWRGRCTQYRAEPPTRFRDADLATTCLGAGEALWKAEEEGTVTALNEECAARIVTARSGSKRAFRKVKEITR